MSSQDTSTPGTSRLLISFAIALHFLFSFLQRFVSSKGNRNSLTRQNFLGGKNKQNCIRFPNLPFQGHKLLSHSETGPKWMRYTVLTNVIITGPHVTYMTLVLISDLLYY